MRSDFGKQNEHSLPHHRLSQMPQCEYTAYDSHGIPGAIENVLYLAHSAYVGWFRWATVLDASRQRPDTDTNRSDSTKRDSISNASATVFCIVQLDSALRAAVKLTLRSN